MKEKSTFLTDIRHRIVYLSYPGHSYLISDNLDSQILEHIQFVECIFDDTVSTVRDMLKEDKVDVIITGGSNAKLIKENYPNQPLVTIGVNEFDIFRALIRAKELGNSATIVTYEDKFFKTLYYESILNFNLKQKTFLDKYSLDDVFINLKKDGEQSIIGSSIVCDYARKYNFNTIFIYSPESIKKAFDTAIDLQLSILYEKKRSVLLNTVLNYVYTGVISIDSNGYVQTFNYAAEKIMNIRKNDILDKNINNIIPNTKLNKVVLSKKMELNQLQKINNDLTIITNRVPIIIDGACTGAVATFHDIKDVQNAEHHIRKELSQRKLSAKYTFDHILGFSTSINNAKTLSKIYAQTDKSVLLHGPTGSGKELFAQAIHNYSDRNEQPFVAINCAALPESLLESELFGYERGAFTGADKEGKTGLIELAHGGTLFLDEISEIPLKLQVYLLRFLQEKEILRIGGRKIIPINTRILSSTNKDLWYEVEKGTFRADLYYRLNTLYLKIPSLKDRIEDIPQIIKNIVQNYNDYLYDENLKVWNVLIEYLSGLEWHGNIRELENVVTRYCIMLDKYDIFKSINKNVIIDSNDILQYLNYCESMFLGNYSHSQQTNNSCQVKNMKNDEYIKSFQEKEYIINALDKVKWNKGKAAKELGYSRTTLWRKMKYHGL